MSSDSPITPAELAEDTTGVQVVDVREPDELASGRIQGSTNIPLGQLAARAGELDRDTPVVTVCQSGRRSLQAADTLAAAGFRARSMDGGMSAWSEAGRPTV